MKYQYLLFDLDGTLLDFLKSEAVSIREAFQSFGLPHNDAAVQLYSKINDSYWKRYEKGEIKRSEIFAGRFQTFLAQIGQPGDPQALCDAYFLKLSQSTYLLPGALPLLQALKGRYTLCAATNGYAVTQHNRLQLSGLKEYFNYLFISEEMQTKKPDKQFFDLAFGALGCKNPKQALMIGDSLSSDIAGGLTAGCDTCFVNLSGQSVTPPPGTTYTVTALNQIIPVCGL